jgi:pimeloyl-ACP methyl ester carboxylesterase
MVERIEYDEFGLFHENAEEWDLPYDGPPTVRRQSVPLPDGRHISALVWGSGQPELVLLHGGSQNAHTWDTVAMALGRPMVALDLPGHGHSDQGRPVSDRRSGIQANAEDVSVAIRQLAPEAGAVVGMSLGGITTIALADLAPELVRKVVLVDVTPGVSPAKAKQIFDFVNGPPSFDSFDDLLERTIQFNPTRTVSSLRRGILHNAIQQDDGTWVWRWARWPAETRASAEQPPDASSESPMFDELWNVLAAMAVPVMLCRGMLPQSVVGDEDEAELRRRQPDAHIVHFDHAGHSIQGDMPIDLAREIDSFVFG